MKNKLFPSLFSMCIAIAALTGCASSGTQNNSSSDATPANAMNCEVEDAATGSHMSHRHCTPVSAKNDTPAAPDSGKSN